MSRIKRPLTFAVHEKLQNEINEKIIAIRLHHCHPPERTEKPENWDKAKSHYTEPTWEEVVDLMMKAIMALDEQRYDPRKY